MMLMFSQVLRQGGRQRAIKGGPHHGKSKLQKPSPISASVRRLLKST